MLLWMRVCLKDFRMVKKNPLGCLIFISHITHGERSWSNIRVLKAIFLLFELVVGLQVNFLRVLLWVSIFLSLGWRRHLGPLIVTRVIHLLIIWVCLLEEI